MLSTGRSGSTLLEMLLATHPEVASLGELHLLPHLLDDTDARCQCGAALRACPWWGPIVAAHPDRAPIDTLSWFRESKDAGRVVRWRWIPGLITGRATRRTRARARSYRVITLEAARRAGARCGARVVVDASKDPYRLHLLRAGGVEVLVVHLVRDPRGFVASTVGGSAASRERAGTRPRAWRVARVAARWSVQQMLFERASARAEPPLLMRYEDLASDPEGQLERLARLVGIDPAGFDPSAFRATPGHAVGGNPMRHRSDPIVLDERWRSELSRRHARLVWWICAPMARRYGYQRRG